MARAPNENVIKAKKLYDKGYKLIDISKELNTPEGTIRSWKNRYNWDDDNNATLQKKEKKKRNVANKNANKKKTKKEPIADEVKEVLENTELTDKQRLFCVIYSRCLNATNAYQEVYKCTYETAMVNGCNLLRNTKIKEQIEKLNAVEFNKEFIKRSVIQKYIDIAFADISKFAKFGKRDKIQYDSNGQPIMEDGKLKTYEESYLELKESDRVDGTLITEISGNKDVFKIKLADKMKAMDFLSKYSNLLSDEEKLKLDIEYKKLANRKLGAEIAKINGESDDDEKEDDGFIGALAGTAKEDWADEEI
ncbi:terminase small subunit [Clostridium sp.]|uniref:terminase small subunit n=1 Tax=Clostridium sp. TaxID=1506 RepID=UPI00284C275D|nr:terminase small subunit [Clostridium sp.]MDR3598740.1 terminase small subunit [Clostridium sp.]